MTLTEHNLIISTYQAGDRVQVKVRHRLSGLEATSDVCEHRIAARAQAMARLEALMADDGGEAA